MKKCIFALALLLAGHPAWAFGMQTYLDGDLRYASSNSQSDMFNSGWDNEAVGHLILVPAMELSQDAAFLPLFMAQTSAQEQPVEEDPHGYLASQTLLMAKPALELRGSGYKWQLRGDAERDITLESRDSPWSEGLYDYEQWGGGLLVESRQSLWGLDKASLSLDVAHRAYINYHNPAPTGGSNWRIKDYLGPRLGVSARTQLLGWDAQLRYDLLWQDYDDADLVKPDGSVDTGAKRQDYYHDALADLSRPGGAGIPGLRIELIELASDQNYFDPSDVYLPDYYSFRSISLQPYVRIQPQGPQGPALTLAYQFLLRDYLHRRIQNASASFANGTEEDNEHTVSLDGRCPLWGGLSLVGSWSYWLVRSNTEYSGGLKPELSLFKANLGLAYRL
jgi:hypothetical protein